jgi:RNA polymerase sigma-70 factor (ECF subfamily)
VTAPDFDGFEALVRENQGVVFQIAYGVLGNGADAQDVTQDVFVRAHAKLASLRDPGRFRAWVCSISRRLALNRVRTQTRARNRQRALDAAMPTVIDVELLAQDREFEASVNREIDRLPPKLRETLLLCAIEGLEPAGVARLLNIPPGTVRSRLFLARKALLRSLSP